MSIYTDTWLCLVQLQFVPQLLHWVALLNNNSETPAYKQLDLGSIAIAGHSRGGKMAALAFATGALISVTTVQPFSIMIHTCEDMCIEGKWGL